MNTNEKRPDPIQVLADHLREAKDRFKSVGDDGYEGARYALNAVLQMLATVDPFKTEKLGIPLMALGVALLDLEHGTVAPMLSPKKVRHRPPASTRDVSVMVASSAVLSMLIRLGLGKDAAAKQVVRTLQKAGEHKLKSGKSITSRTVATWRSRITERKASQAAQDKFWLLMKRFAPKVEAIKKNAEQARLPIEGVVDRVLLLIPRAISLLEKST